MKNRWIVILSLALYFLPQASRAASENLREFIYSAPGTYGWQPVKGSISYDFFTDGRLAVQGPDGEATMWEGTWTLKGDQLTLNVPALKTHKTFTATAKGGELFLNDQRYIRYKP